MAAAVVRPRADDPFDIHEDARTEETEMMVDEDADHLANDAARAVATDDLMDQVEEELDEEEGEDEDEDDDISDDEQVESSVQSDMDKLASDFPGFRGKYRLIKRIGEGRWQLNSLTREDG